MKTSPARLQAALALGFAALLWAAWALFGTPMKVRWIVARGAPPAKGMASDAAIEEIRASDVLEESMATARHFASLATSALDELPPGDPKDSLAGLVDYVLERRT